MFIMMPRQCRIDKSLSGNCKGSFGASIGVGRRWLGPYSPLRGCADLTVLATAKIHCRRPTLNFQTGSMIVV